MNSKTYQMLKLSGIDSTSSRPPPPLAGTRRSLRRHSESTRSSVLEISGGPARPPKLGQVSKLKLDPLIQRKQVGRSTIGTGKEEARERRDGRRREDELDTITYHERTEPIAECTVPRSEFIRQLAPGSSKLQSQDFLAASPALREEVKSLSSIHSSFGRLTSGAENVRGSREMNGPHTARFGGGTTRKGSNRQDPIISPRYGTAPHSLTKQLVA